MVLDLSPVFDGFVVVVMTIVSGALSFGVRVMVKRLDLQDAEHLVATVDKLAEAAAGDAYRKAILAKQDLTSPAGQQAAMAIGARYMQDHIPETIMKAGLTDDGVREIVGARIGKLLASDPTVAPTQPPT